MKRNGMTVPPAPRSFEELKLARSAAGTSSNHNNSSNTDVMTASRADDAGEDDPTAVQQPVLSSSFPSDARSGAAPFVLEDRRSSNSGGGVGGGTGQRHRYDLEDDDEGGAAVAAPTSLSGYAGASASPPHETRGAQGIDLSKSPTTAALAAGARAAGAAQPYFFSLKLPPPTISHVGGGAAAGRSGQLANNTTASLDTNTCDSPHVAVAASNERPHRAGGYARTASTSSPQRLEDTVTGTTPRVPGTFSSGAGNNDDNTGGRQPSPIMLPRDVGPLPASQARARNRLPSGTHIRRRPRSVANRRTGGSGTLTLGSVNLMDSTDNAAFLGNTVDFGSPTVPVLDASGTAGGRISFASPGLKPRAAAVATSGRGAGGRGTGRAREVLPPGPRSGAGAGVPHRRRADPSPAPSRPPRARKAAAVIRATAAPGTPLLGVSAAPTMSPSSPTQLELARSHTSAQQQPSDHERGAVAAMASLGASTPSPQAQPQHHHQQQQQQQQHPTWSIPNSPGVSSPLNSSIDTKFLLSGDRDVATAAEGSGNVGSSSSMAHLNSSGTAPGNYRSGRTATAARPPSGRILGSSVARTHTPRASTASVRGVEDSHANTNTTTATPTRLDHAKLAEHYVQLCTAVGELPNLEWVSGLQVGERGGAGTSAATLGGALGDIPLAERLSCNDFTTAGSSDVKEQHAAHAGSPQEASLATSGAPSQITTQPQQQQQQGQTLTPRGGATRQRSGAGTASLTPRARTPVASRAKSPRGGAAGTAAGGAATAAGGGAAKRSGSVGRITTVNRASILGSSQTHGSGAVHTPRTRGATSGRSGAASASNPASAAPSLPLPPPSSSPRESVADVYAQRVSQYCAEHLQPYVDNMKQIQQQRQALEEVLSAFVSTAAAVITPATTTTAAAGGEANRKSQTPLPLAAGHPTTGTSHSGTSSVSHSYRGPPGSGKGVPAAAAAAGALPSPSPSSRGTTPRRPSTSRTSAAAALPNTASAAAAAIMSRRSAAAASVKAASLTDGLQSVQGAVVALLSALADGTKLADLPVLPAEDDLASSNSQSLSKSGAFPQSYSVFAPVASSSPTPAAGLGSSTHAVLAPAERSQTMAQLVSPPPPSALASLPAKASPPLALQTNTTVPFLPLSTAIGSSRTVPTAGGGGKSTKPLTVFECGRTGISTATTACPPPMRFLDFVEAQERAIAAQLSKVCDTVRAALGAPAAPKETTDDSRGATPPPATTATTATTATPSVQLEQADMLDNPFFVPTRYLHNLAATLASTQAEEEPAEAGTPKLPTSAHAKPSPAATPKSGKSTVKKPKSAKSAGSGGGLGSSIGGETGGGITGRSSKDSTPRNRASVSASVFAPLFTVRLSADDATPISSGVHAGNDAADPHRRSISLSSTENATLAAADASASGLAETFILHCVQPTATGLTPRPSFDSDMYSSPQSSAQFTVMDLAASAASLASNTGNSMQATPTPTKEGGGGGGGGNKSAKRATSAGAGKRGSGAGQRSKSSGASTRAAVSAEPPRATLAASWLNSQGNRSSGTTTKRKSKKSSTSTSGLNNTLSGSIGGATGTASAFHHQRTQSHQTSGAVPVALQRRLAVAWQLWSALEQRFADAHHEAAVATRPTTPQGTGADAAASEGQDDARRPGSASQTEPLSTSPRMRVGGAGASSAEELTTGAAAAADAITRASVSSAEQDSRTVVSTTTPLTANAATAAATPSHTVVVEVPVFDSGAQPSAASRDSEVRASWGEEVAAHGPLGSQMSSPDKHLEGTVKPSKTAIFTEPSTVLKDPSDEDDVDTDALEEENPTFSTTTAQVAANMASLSSALRVPRRLDLEESGLQTQSDLVNAPASKQSSQSTAPHALSATLPQHIALTSASAVTSDDVLASSDVAPKRIGEEERRAAQIIRAWWLRARQRRAQAAELHARHAIASMQQRRKLLEGRVRLFLLRCVCRQRLQRRLRARAAEEQIAEEARRARDAADAASCEAGTAATSTLAAKRGGRSPTSTSTSSPTLAASASREKFLRSKEQRKAMTATGKDSRDVSGSLRVPPPLPLAASGISTFAVGEYESDSSFSVSVMHRLLHAPPSLLYATCTAALHYPTHPPMAYLDNTSRAKSGGNENERQQSEAPPDPETRVGEGAAGSVSKQGHRGSPGRGGGNDGRGSAVSSPPLWRSKGVCFVPTREVRAYLGGAYEARVPPRTVPAAMDRTQVNAGGTATSLSLLDSTVNSLTTSYRGGSRQQTSATMVLVPGTMRYESVVDPNELRHPRPVTKTFHRPFEQWGMAYNLTSRIFCAAAIYAWQLIFSHTPFDDAKQRELPTREDRQARLERVAERNDIILDCYCVRSEREWMREATKDLSFVGQICLPNYASDDPGQEREARDNYDFVKNFLFQCFPNINKLADIQDFLVGAGVFFVLKEVFHVSRDAPLTRRVQKYIPRLLVKGNEDYLRAVTPASSPLYAGADDVGSDDDDLLAFRQPIVAPTSLATPRATDYGKGGNGLSGLQRAALHRYEQLRQLHHLSYGMADAEERAACAWAALPLPASKDAPPQQQGVKPRSPSAAAGGAASASKTGKDRTKAPSLLPTQEEKERNTLAGTSSSIATSASEDALNATTVPAGATSPIRRYMAHGAAGPMTPLRATPTTTALSSAFNSPAVMREGPRRGSAAAVKPAASASSPPPPKPSLLPPRESDIQLAHVPHRLLRTSAADAAFVRDFEDEVSRSVHRIIDNVSGFNNDLSLNSTDLPVAMAAGVDVHDALDIAYPDHFLVKLSELLVSELFGLQVSLSSCEDLDSTSS